MTDDSRKRRRRRRRIIASAAFLTISLTLAWIFESQSTTTVIFVRYADVNVDTGDNANPGLNPAGQIRAEELVRVVGDIDVIASVDAIFATQFRKTQETAEPLAKSLQMPVQVIDAENVRGLTDLILQEYKGKIVLVITNRKALPQLIQRFHGSKNLPEIEDDEFDNLYIVSIPWYGKVKTLRLKYGARYIADE
jgi:2,3-bisphosphoglycerate-dependent phosphoglycerate mutase